MVLSGALYGRRERIMLGQRARGLWGVELFWGMNRGGRQSVKPMENVCEVDVCVRWTLLPGRVGFDVVT